MKAIYLILGARDSGQAEILSDFIEEGFPKDEQVSVLFAEEELQVGVASELVNVEKVRVAGWGFFDEEIQVNSSDELCDVVFFVANGSQNPVDQIEAFKGFTEKNDFELQKIITVVDCQLAEKYPELSKWYEACIYFSDNVLLNKKENVNSKWINSFIKWYESDFYACIFEHVKNGRVNNPAMTLFPEARRRSFFFDEFDLMEDEDSEESLDSDETLKTDPYMERGLDGKRCKELPDIAKFLK